MVSIYTLLAIAVKHITRQIFIISSSFYWCEIDYMEDAPNVHGGAMWARMPIQALVADIPLEEWPEPMEDHLAQPWDC